MNQLFQELNKRREYLQDLMREIDDKLYDVPQGKLRVSNINGIPRYYHMTKPGDTKGKYIQKKNKDLACRRVNCLKLDEYRRNGIYLGKNLLITYEGEGCYLNIKEIKKMIQEMFGELR